MKRPTLGWEGALPDRKGQGFLRMMNKRLAGGTDASPEMNFGCHVSGLHVGLRFRSRRYLHNLDVSKTTFLAARSAIFSFTGLLLDPVNSPLLLVALRSS